MTLKELKLIKDVIEDYANAWGSNQPTNRALNVVQREINLRVMDVTKSKEDDTNLTRKENDNG